MDPVRLSLDHLAVQSFIVDPEPGTVRPAPEPIRDPIGYETDEGRQSLCIVSCAGTCGGC